MQLTSSHTQVLNRLCPTGRYVAGVSQGSHLVVRSFPSLAVHANFSAVDRIDSISWNSNGTLILATVSSQGILHVWSILDHEWSCRVDIGSAGLQSAIFCGLKNLFVVTDFGLRLKIFNLDEIELSPKFIKNTFTVPVLSPDGKYFALVVDSTDIGIVDTSDMTMVRRFSIGSVSNLVWTGDSSSVVAFETGLGNRISVVDIETGSLKSSHAFSSSENQVGVRCVESNRFYLVVGCFTEKLTVYDIRSGVDLLAHISLASCHLLVLDDCPRVFRESLGGDASVRDRNLFQLGGRNELGFPVEYREVVPEDTLVESVKRIEIPSAQGVTVLTNAGPPRGGICEIRLSPDGAWLAVQTDEKASVVFIIDLTRVRVTSVLVHRQPVRSFSWNPRNTGDSAILAIVLGDSRVHLWEPAIYSHNCIELNEKNFDVLSALWNSTGEYIVAESEHAVCCVSVEPHLEPIGG